MQLKSITISLAVAKLVAVVSADITAASYYNSLASSVDPTNITIPTLDQTTSYDPTTECTYYSPDSSLVSINASEFPNIWEVATTNGMNTSAEFTALYNSIDWTQAPDISVRTLDADGNLDTSSYDTATDSDCWWSATTCTVPKLSDVNADIYKCDEPETWGLTYDDGPNCSHNAFYDYLQEKSLKASMFYIGSNVIDWPYGAMRGVKDGHHIASHTWSHAQMTTLTNQEVLAELYFTQKAIKIATGLTPRYWRPPYGDVDDRVRWIASQLGLTAVIWNLDTDDWAAGTTTTLEAVEQTYQDYVEMGTNGTFATDGNIVLTHEINNMTMGLALEYLPKITAAYKQVLDVATCQNISYPYFENYAWTSVLNGTSTTSDNSTETTTSSDDSTETDASTAAQLNAVTNNAGALVPGMTLMAAFVVALVM
ncbi:chitin deacetylase [Gilbertella persicaria]|uniref:chitin deacetylase n=1 Tax=Gilbertella persicaria TaxID=101096 RepID=UPI00221FDE38|nr:chitin deacetylase [Gilbertella persicaria]KAI8075413.1 chitin deacetylase [Gilbertella persicaria]